MNPKLRLLPAMPITVPDAIAAMVDGYRWQRDTVGESGGQVFRLDGLGLRSLYLKCGRDEVANAISREYERAQWLADYIETPQILAFEARNGQAFLLMGAIEGETIYQAIAKDRSQTDNLAFATGAYLAHLHAVPTGACPFDSTIESRLTIARQNIDLGLVDEDDFDEVRSGWSAEMVWQRIMELLPTSRETVVTHGDYSLDNIFVSDGVINGLIDLDRAGIADPYQDIAIAMNCFGEFGPSATRQFLAGYGIKEIDADRVELHLCLDELF